MEALDTDRIWIACLFMTLVSITIVVAQDRHYSPADPPHTKAYSIINPVPLLPQPNGSKQQGTWVLLFCVSLPPGPEARAPSLTLSRSGNGSILHWPASLTRTACLKPCMTFSCSGPGGLSLDHVPRKPRLVKPERAHTLDNARSHELAVQFGAERTPWRCETSRPTSSCTPWPHPCGGVAPPRLP